MRPCVPVVYVAQGEVQLVCEYLGNPFTTQTRRLESIDLASLPCSIQRRLDKPSRVDPNTETPPRPVRRSEFHHNYPAVQLHKFHQEHQTHERQQMTFLMRLPVRR